MQTSKPTIREVYEKKRLTAEEKCAAEENRVAEERGTAEGTDVNPEASRTQEVPLAAAPAVPGLAEMDDAGLALTDPPVEAAKQAIVALLARDKASASVLRLMTPRRIRGRKRRRSWRKRRINLLSLKIRSLW